jgi:hypothetical protein
MNIENMRVTAATLKAGLIALQGLKAEISDLQTMAPTVASRRAELVASVDFGDSQALDELGRTVVVEQALPQRIAAREGALARAEAELLGAAHQFITGDLGPRQREAAKRVRASAREALRSHFGEESELDRAVEGSLSVRRVEGLAVSLTHTPPDVAQYVSGLLEASAAVDALLK